MSPDDARIEFSNRSRIVARGLSRMMERIELTRECEGVQVPAGTRTTLEKGLEVFITQSLGGTYTVQVPAHAGLFRISGKDADALGKTPEQGSEAAAGGDVEA